MDQVNGKRRRHHHPSRSPGTPKMPVFESRLDRVGTSALWGILFVVPLMMGGRHPLGRLAYLVFVGVLAITWLVRQAIAAPNARYRPTGIGWLLGAAIALVVLQVVPLPSYMIQTLSPFQAEMLPTWTDSATLFSFGVWNRLSLAPLSTQAGIVTLTVHVVLFLVMVQWLKDWRHVERLLKWVALATISVATIGFIQYLSGTSKFVWIFNHPSRDASRSLCGPFANSNHFSHFLAIGIGPVLWWLHVALQGRHVTGPAPIFRKYNSQQTSDYSHVALIGSIGLIATCCLLARSRGGILVMFLTVFLTISLMAIKGLFNGRTLAAVSVTGLIVAIALSIHGKDNIVSELSTMTSLDTIDKSENRRNVWRANIEAAKRFSIFGTGVGSHDEIYHRFFPHPSEVEYTHAESGFLQVLTETGVPGLGLVLLLIGACGHCLYSLIRRVPLERFPTVVGVTAALFASVTHSVIDFVWYVPACMSATILIAAVAFRMSQITLSDAENGNELPAIENKSTSNSPRHRIQLGKVMSGGGTWSIIAAAVLVLFLGMGGMQWRAIYASFPWQRYLEFALASTPPITIVEEENESTEAKAIRIEQERIRDEQVAQRMVEELETTIRRDPQHVRANIRLASLRIRQFEKAQLQSENAMTLAQIRDAAYASLEVDPAAVDPWLTKVLGKNRELIEDALKFARTAVNDSPSSGRGYLYMSEVAFLDGVSRVGAEQLVQQAYATRPYDATIWLTMAEHAMQRGDIHTTFQLRRRAFHQDVDCRDTIINGLAGQMPATVFLQQFEPDEYGLRSLLRFYLFNHQVVDARVVASFLGDYVVKRAQAAEGEIASDYWVRATMLYRMAGNPQQTLECAGTAAKMAPNSLRARQLYATELYRNELWSLAIPELRWCLNRQPTDQNVKKMLAVAARTSQRTKSTSR